MQQQFEQQQQSEHPGYTQEEYREVVRRAQQIRAEKEGRLSQELLAESAAEVGIREEDLREAARQLQAEKEQLAARRKQMQMIGAVAAAVLALLLVFSYNGLSSQRSAVMQARANVQATLQRRLDVVPQVAKMAREGAANEQEVAERLARARAGLQSGDVNAQLRANEELKGALEQVQSDPQFRSSEMYRDLMAQIEGSENRINVARQRYNEAVSRYNRAAGTFPTSLARPFLGFPGEMQYFEASRDVSKPPAL